MPAGLSSLLKIVPPKGKQKQGGSALTPSFNPNNTNRPLARTGGREHTEDLVDVRVANDSGALVQRFMRLDPDVSAAANAFLTTADTEPYWAVRDVEGNIDRDGHKLVQQILQSLFTRTDYTRPSKFAFKQNLRQTCADMRYFLLMRGAIMGELVVNKQMAPDSIRLVDPTSVEFTEKASGVLIPQQTTGSGDPISLDIPSFFVSYFRRDPTSVYPKSFFLSSINTIAARHQVINDLYRIMSKTGFPRVTVKVVEEVLLKNAPADVRSDPNELSRWITDRFNEIEQTFSDLRADEALVHTDTMEPRILNEKNPAAQLDVSQIVETLNAQNQAALKVMATVIGRGESGVNTASVEARIFSLNAEQLNKPLADFMSQLLTFALRLNGSESRVEFNFERVEMRPEMELEPQKSVKQTRMLNLLSYGLISDDEFHLKMFNRIRPDEIEERSGTGFMNQNDSIDVEDVSPNSDPLGRSITPDGSKQARSNEQDN